METRSLKTLYNRGFTLVELLVALAIVGIVLAGIYSAYYSQQKSYLAQDQVAAMQQNLRAGLDVMVKEIRMAGYDPTRSAHAGIVTAQSSTITFTQDTDRDGAIGADETITYSLADSDADGDTDLLRNAAHLAEDVGAIDFIYLDGASPPNVLNDPGTGAVLAQSIPAIRSIQITMVAKTGRGDLGYTNTAVYYNQQDLFNPILDVQNDNFRRKRLTVQVKCRNLGLK